MTARTALTLVTGSLGSGKTTLLRHILDTIPKRIAILMNEFGELAIDKKIIAGENVQMVELDGGCVCCSLIGEFETAVNEIIEVTAPEHIVVETTGLAEPDALVVDVQEELPQVRLDGVITVADADALVRYPQLGHTTRMQIEAADLLIVNKTDLISAEQLEAERSRLARLNGTALIVNACRCRVDPDLLFGIGGERQVIPPRHVHQLQFQSFSYVSEGIFDRRCFECFANTLGEAVYRAKGFIRFADGSVLFNFVAGRWELEPFEAERTELVFIGEDAERSKPEIHAALDNCER